MESASTRNKHLWRGGGVIAAAIAALLTYYEYNEIYPKTDNAYVNANLVNIAAKVSGYIKTIYVENNQLVHKGDLLLEIDPVDYNLQLIKARQDLELAMQQATNYKQQIISAKSGVAKAYADFQFATQMAARYQQLYQQKAGSLQDMQKYQNQKIAAQQALDQQIVGLTQANTQYAVANTQIKIAQTNKSNALNNNAYTQLHAPVDGYISNLFLQKGELVSGGQKLFALVDNSAWWVDVNFKETQLKRIKPGQSAQISLDLYDHKYHGKVSSISYASGNTFSLLPAQNATGNWVKVTQRFTVRVQLANEVNFPLRVGASAQVQINTR
jgi:membrane fusion protein (multidrug efflux system)